ncbi:MAG: purine-nucleoside phosphorylase [Acidimicrobiales bacterium]
MSTSHIAAEPGDFAPTVLMPGDPLRAKMIAERYFDDAREVTSVRNMLGFTGTYNGKPVSVQGSGMGVPSIQIYASELFDHFDVEQIIRVGSCGAIQPDLPLRTLIIASGAGTDSNVNRVRASGYDFAATPDFGLLRAAVEAAEAAGIDPTVGRIFTSDFFYHPNGMAEFDLLAKAGFLAVEMEAAALYGLAIERGKKALTVATVSDQIITGDVMSVEERQESLDQMIKVALEAGTR